MATQPIGSWQKAGVAQGGGGGFAESPLVGGLKKGLPTGGWGTMGVVPNAVAGFTKAAAPPPLAAAPAPMQAMAPAVSSIAQSMSAAPGPMGQVPSVAQKMKWRAEEAAAAAATPTPAPAFQEGAAMPGLASMLGGYSKASAPPTAAPQFSDPYEAMKQARLGGRPAPEAAVDGGGFMGNIASRMRELVAPPEAQAAPNIAQAIQRGGFTGRRGRRG